MQKNYLSVYNYSMSKRICNAVNVNNNKNNGNVCFIRTRSNDVEQSKGCPYIQIN